MNATLATLATLATFGPASTGHFRPHPGRTITQLEHHLHSAVYRKKREMYRSHSHRNEREKGAMKMKKIETPEKEECGLVYTLSTEI